VTARLQLRNGREFVLDAPTTVPAIWGRERDVIWSAGEPLLICGPQGVGKSTLLQQLVLARIGVAIAADVIGYPVARAQRRVLYLAADRPRQIARSLRRMVSEADAQTLEDQLIVWEGPLPFNFVKQPELLAEWVAEADAGDLYIDSLKDIASPLSSDEVGSAYNRAVGAVIAAGVEVAANHHQRKATAENRKPTSLADVYGSTWITSGAGSVVCLWGQPGDPLVEFIHLKQPAEEVGPFDLEHDHERGRTTRRERPDAWTLLQAATLGGIAAKDAAAALYDNPTKAQIEKTRRRFERFVKDGHAVRADPTGKFADVLYRPTVPNGRVTDRDEPRDEARAQHAPARKPENNRHATVTHRHADHRVTSPLKEWGERDGHNDRPDDNGNRPLNDDEIVRCLVTKLGGTEETGPYNDLITDAENTYAHVQATFGNDVQ
jgi:replicative DNA helicase